MAGQISGKLNRQREPKRPSGLTAGAPLRGSPTFGGFPSRSSRPPQGGRSTSPPAAAPPLPPRSSIPAAQRPQKAVSKMGQADRLRLDPTASQDGRPQGWTPRRGAAPQESNGQPGSGIARNGEAGQGWHRPPAPPERAQDARSRPRPGLGRPTLEKRLYGPPMRSESAGPGAQRPNWPGGRVVFDHSQAQGRSCAGPPRLWHLWAVLRLSQ